MSPAGPRPDAGPRRAAGPSGASTRRTLLRRTAASAVVLAAPALLAACGDEPGPGPQERATTARSIGVDIASYYAPVEALRRQVTSRATATRALPTFSDDAAGVAAQRATLKRWLDPDDGFDAVVVSPFDVGAVAGAVRTAVDAGIHVVAYVTPIPGASAAIAVDPAAAGELLVRHLAAWAAREGVDRGEVVLVGPGPGAAVPDPLAPLGPPTLRSITAALARAAPGLRVVATVPALAAADATSAVTAALAQYPDARIVLGWNDATAVGAAAALREHVPSGERDAAYAGGVALGGPTALTTLDALRGRALLRAVVAPSLRDLGAAAVDLPLALLRGGRAADVRVRPRVLTPGSSALRRARADLRPPG